MILEDFHTRVCVCVCAIYQESEPVKPVGEAVPILADDMTTSPNVQENCRFTRSMAQPSGSGVCLLFIVRVAVKASFTKTGA